jgi:hypothetical protein
MRSILSPEGALRPEIIARLVLLRTGAERHRSTHCRSITDTDGVTSETLNICLKSGNGGILLGDPHLEVGELSKENRGVINGGVHLGLFKTC